MKWPKISEWDQPSTQSNGGDLTSYWHIWDYCIRATFPYVSAAPPYNRQALKIPTLVSTRPAFPAPQTRHPRVFTNSLRRLPTRCRMSGRGIKSAETSDRLAQIYAPDRLTQIPCAGEGGMGTASATTPRRRRRQGGQHLHYSRAFRLDR